ncbi:Flp family type IVb pilin [Caballeronia sp. GAWG2-1]|uniref:Flp family type IVb pilin n=1 Tax=Caballeronia sp. GAWG2-1 TaxID=2921744 RepID=UPI0032ED274E
MQTTNRYTGQRLHNVEPEDQIMTHFFKRYLKDTRGITAIEYGLIAGVLALGIMTSVSGVATQLSTTFSAITTKLSTIH